MGVSGGRTYVARELHVVAAVVGREASRVAIARPTATVVGARSLDAARAVLAGAAQPRAETTTCRPLLPVAVMMRAPLRRRLGRRRSREHRGRRHHQQADDADGDVERRTPAITAAEHCAEMQPL